jgi:uncharacterized protein with FMN-binding domain
MKKRKTQNRFVRTSRKLLLSAFLVTSFGAYALEHGGRTGAPVEPPPVADSGAAAGTRAPQASAAAPSPATPGEVASSATAEPAATNAPPAPTAVPTAEPTPTSAPAVAAANGLKDGTFDGPPVDVRWGLVQVEATIQGGKLTNVQFLQYPSDRRTSQRINSQVVPWLQQEAMQAQSANVDLITGATLTSEGFAESLQAALDRARS